MQNNKPIDEVFRHSTDINRIIQSAIEAVDPYACVKKVIRRKSTSLSIGDERFDLKKIDFIYLIGAGKAVLPMACAVSEEIGDLLSEGVLITKHMNKTIQLKLDNSIQVYKGSHPVPDQNSLDATQKMLDLLKKVTARDFVIGLISGGGSALLTNPNCEIGLTGMQTVTTALLKSGATIDEMNTIRKHLDNVKGGGLLKAIHPAKSVHLILSDVLGDSLSMIASGPTSADPTTYKDCLEIIEKYQLKDQIDHNVISYMVKGKSGLLDETVKENDPILKNHKNHIIGSLSIAAQAAYNQAKELGYETKMLSTLIKGEASNVGINLASTLIKETESRKNREIPVCLIAGGETTVTVKGSGKGGRNQEIALAAAQVLEGRQDCIFISLATDGEDGPTDAAGAIVNGETIIKGINMKMKAADYLINNNAYEYLQNVGSLIKTGPTGTNVNDLILMFAY